MIPLRPGAGRPQAQGFSPTGPGAGRRFFVVVCAPPPPPARWRPPHGVAHAPARDALLRRPQARRNTSIPIHQIRWLT